MGGGLIGMCGAAAKPWAEQRHGVWVARDMDGYTLRVAPRKGEWRWCVRPPGGGYDVSSGTESDLEKAKAQAETAYRLLYEEIRKSLRKMPKTSR
jgi:hypothetical protein